MRVGATEPSFWTFGFGVRNMQRERSLRNTLAGLGLPTVAGKLKDFKPSRDGSILRG